MNWSAPSLSSQAVVSSRPKDSSCARSERQPKGSATESPPGREKAARRRPNANNCSASSPTAALSCRLATPLVLLRNRLDRLGGYMFDRRAVLQGLHLHRCHSAFNSILFDDVTNYHVTASASHRREYLRVLV